MTNYQYLMRFLKEYNLIRKKHIVNNLANLTSKKEDISYQQLFNFINHSCEWNCTDEGRLFWEKHHYYCIKYFYDISQNKDKVKEILKRTCYYFLNGGLFLEIEHDKIWEEITEFKKKNIFVKNMRIFVRKAKEIDFIHRNYLLIIKDEKSKTSLPYDFYCGLYDGKSSMNKALYLRNKYSTFHCVLIDGIMFSYPFLCRNIHQVYIITEKEYSMFTKCKTKEEIHKLIDNIYYEN